MTNETDYFWDALVAELALADLAGENAIQWLLRQLDQDIRENPNIPSRPGDARATPNSCENTTSFEEGHQDCCPPGVQTATGACRTRAANHDDSRGGPRVISLIGSKGGCGRTTIAINLAASFAEIGLRTLLVDMDPKADCTYGLGIPDDQIDLHIGNTLLADADSPLNLPSSVIWRISGHLDFIPSKPDLLIFEQRLADVYAAEKRLSAVLEETRDCYDVILVDSPSTLGLLALNAIYAADLVMIPADASCFSSRGPRSAMA